MISIYPKFETLFDDSIKYKKKRQKEKGKEKRKNNVQHSVRTECIRVPDGSVRSASQEV